VDDDWRELVILEWQARLCRASPLERQRILQWCERWHCTPDRYLEQFYRAWCEKRAYGFAPPV
jgi:hypothetical protein